MLWPVFHSSVSTEPHGRVPLLRLLKERSISGSVQVNCRPSSSYFHATRTPEDVKHAKQTETWVYFGCAVLWKVLESCCVSILSCCATCPVFIFKVFKRKAEDSNNFFAGLNKPLQDFRVLLLRDQSALFFYLLFFGAFLKVAFVCSCRQTQEILRCD